MKIIDINKDYFCMVNDHNRAGCIVHNCRPNAKELALNLNLENCACFGQACAACNTRTPKEVMDKIAFLFNK